MSMTWNYQIILHDEAEQPYYALHEVYTFGERLEDTFWTEEPFVVGESVADIVTQLAQMIQDLSFLPTLKHTELKPPKKALDAS